MNLLQPMMIAVLLIMGVGVALLGSIKVMLARRLQIDEARVGGMVSVFGFAMIPVIFTAGFLTDLIGRGTVLMAGSILMASSLFLLAQARRYLWAFAAALLLSAGWSLLANAGNVLVPLAFPGDVAQATNLGNVFFGLGAFLTPLLIVPLVRRTSLALTLSLLAVLALVPAFVIPGIDFIPLLPSTGSTADADLGGMHELLTSSAVWLCGLALFFYGPLEASLAAWTTTYLGERNIPEASAGRILSGFWLAFMLGRLFVALTLPPGREALLILVLGLANAALLTGIVLSRRPSTAIGLVLGTGFLMGPIFPTTVAILLGATPAPLQGRAVGLLFTIGGIGWTVIPLLIGAYASRTSIQRGFAIASGAAAGLALVAVGLLLRTATS
jgi:fucose permease